jgi:hypothetical protein
LFGIRIARIELDLRVVPAEHVLSAVSSETPLTLTPTFPTRSKPARIFVQYYSAAASPQLVALAGSPPFLLVPSFDGVLAALEPETGRTLWNLRLPCDPGHSIALLPTPAQVGDKLVVAYSWHNVTGTEVSHHVAMVDLRRGALDYEFPIIELSASVPVAYGTETVRFEPTAHLTRSRLAYVPSPTGLGRILVSFGSLRDQLVWHGWIFEIDLQSWRLFGAARAIAAVFTTTADSDCGDFFSDKVCGGGLWAHGGPLIHRAPDGFEFLVQSGNGRLNIERGMYANSLLRLTPGLRFTPACDPQLCAHFNINNPSPQCLTSCKNLFVPRLLPGDPPLRPADGSCENMSYLQCLNENDWDFGGNAPVRIELDGEHAVYVAAGKAGDVFLIDADVLGLMYDRKQAVMSCGTAADPCPDPMEGLIMTQPKVGWVDGSPVVLIPTYNRGRTNTAGIVAYAITTATGGPRLKELWRVPESSSSEAKQWFRTPPTRLVLQDIGGEQVAWIADSSQQGRLLGISIRDGRVLANARTVGAPISSSELIIYHDTLYVAAFLPGSGDQSWIEAFLIGRHENGLRDVPF